MTLQIWTKHNWTHTFFLSMIARPGGENLDFVQFCQPVIVKAVL